MNANNIINEYIEALSQRSEQSGDSRLDYAMGYLQGTLKSLNLQNYEIEKLRLDTKNLQEIINQNQKKVLTP